MLPAADELGVDLFGAGAHPFAAWSRQQLTEGHRYEELINRTQWWGRQMLIWGVHVHVGHARARPGDAGAVRRCSTPTPTCRRCRRRSPIWAGIDTGYASNRALMFQQLPTAGLPFQFDDLGGVRGVHPGPAHDRRDRGLSEIRWDIRPSRHLGTLENRVCDGVSDLRELAALAALMHCLVVDLDTRLAAGETLPTMPPWHVQENKWRAARYGLDADHHPRRRLQRAAGHRRPRRPARAARAGGPAARLRDGAARRSPTSRGCGASYQRQRAVARETGGDLVAVVDSVVRELRESLRLTARLDRAGGHLQAYAEQPDRPVAARPGRAARPPRRPSTAGSLLGAGRVRLRVTVKNGR